MQKKTILNTMFGCTMLAGALVSIPMPVSASQNPTSVQDVMQGKKIKGTVVDENGEPLIGATVSLGNGKGAVTDLDGNFDLSDVSDKATLTVSYVGYKTQSVPVAGKGGILKIQLKPEDATLNDVVVIGYGVQKKSNVTGAISSIKSEDLQNKVSSNAAESLQGKVSGVQVVNNSGAPGSSPTIRIRGYSSNGSSDPLYVVDGLKVSSIDYLEPSAIESIEVLKDAASAAIYGAEAGNGVVLITTKSGGKDGNTKITLDAQLTYSSLAKKMDLMNAEQFIQYNKEANPGTFETRLNQYYDGKTDTDWQDEMYKTGVMQKYNLGVSGNNKNGTFFVSLGWMQNNGMLLGKDDLYKRFTMQINGTYNIKPWLEVGTSNSLSYINAGVISEGSAQYGMMATLNRMDPLTPVVYEGAIPQYVQDAIDAGLHPYKDSKGRYYGVSWQDDPQTNPVLQLNRNKEGNKAFGINGMTYANFKPFKGFVFTTRLGYRFLNLTYNRYLEAGWNTFGDIGKPEDERPYLENYQHTQRYYQWENFFNYLRQTSFGDWNLMAGMSYSSSEIDRTAVNTNQLTNTASNFRYLDYSTQSADDHVSGYRDIKRQIAYYGRLTWSFLNRYNFQFNFRADSYDAAYLDLDHNWGFFPSFSGGWVFTEEDFMKGVAGGKSPLTFGKLRVSWGKNGSISNLASNGGYMYRATMGTGATVTDFPISPSNNTYYMNGKLYSGIYPGSRLANPKLRWEESTQFDIGLDMRFFNGRLNWTADYYHKMTDGLLVESVAPLTTGSDRVWQNLGKVRNNGFEFELEWRDNIGDFNYSVKGNIATVSNKVVKYRGKGTRINGATLMGGEGYASYFEEGYPIWYLRGYKIDHIDESTGQAVYQDTNNDGQITDDDRVDLGSGIPKFTYGITISLSYKNFDLSAYGAGASGNKILYGLAGAGAQKPLFMYNDRWTETNRSASLPSALYQNDTKFYSSDAFVFSGSYFKIKQIQLGYTLPKSVLQKIKMSSIRAFVSLDNFFTFTDYPGNDPEVRPTDSNAIACDFGGYPISKSVSVGLNVAF